MADSSHIIFWLSMSKLEETWVFFREHLPQVSLWQNPLIWHKSDNKGVLADPDRGPRHTYEVALFGSTGDRKLVGAKADSYSAPTNRANSIHQSEKPQPMLEFFLSMVVDKHSRVFDPTAGSGSALRAAERLGADSILGLDVSEEYVTAANKAIKQQRALESLDA
jgi:DNA modification methylase